MIFQELYVLDVDANEWWLASSAQHKQLRFFPGDTEDSRESEEEEQLS